MQKLLLKRAFLIIVVVLTIQVELMNNKTALFLHCTSLSSFCLQVFNWSIITDGLLWIPHQSRFKESSLFLLDRPGAFGINK